MLKRIICCHFVFIGFLCEILASSHTSPLFSFTKSAYIVTIPENVRGKVYAQPEDPKMGVYLPAQFTKNSIHTDSLVRFKIISGDKQNVFKAESHSIGNFAFLRVRTRPSLDLSINRELTPEFDLLVKGTLKRTNERSNLEAVVRVIVKISDENDLSPLFSPSPHKIQIDPDVAVHSTLLQVTANDPDDGLNGEIYYSLRHGGPPFTINPYTGSISLMRSFLDQELSYTKHTNFKLEILAEDRASRLFVDQISIRSASSTNVEVTVRPLKRRPINVTLIRDDSSVKCGQNLQNFCGTLKIDFEDEYLADVCVVNIGPSPFDNFFQAKFYYRNSSKSIFYELSSLKRLKPGVYDLSLTVSGDGSEAEMDHPPLVYGVSISVPDPCSRTATVSAADQSKSLTVDECALGGGALDLVDWRLANVGREFIWRFLADNTTENDAPFDLDGSTGILRLKKNVALNYRSRRQFNLSIESLDKSCIGGNDALTGTAPSRYLHAVVVTVSDCNNHAPVFNESSCSTVFVNAATRLDETLCEIRASDADEGDNGLLYYSIRTSDKNISELFKIDPLIGDLKLSRPVFDDLWGRTLLLKIQASDYGSPFSLTAQSTVEVFFGTNLLTTGPAAKKHQVPSSMQRPPIVDYPLNLHAPMFDPSADDDVISVYEKAPVGGTVYRFLAHDADPGPSGRLRYAIVDGDPSDDWRLDLWTAHLAPSRPLDRELRPAGYSITVEARDCAYPVPQKSARRTFKILLIDSNDNAPSFDQRLYYFEVDERAEAGWLVGQVRASDPDAGSNGTIVAYDLVGPYGPHGSDFFTVDRINGQIRVGSRSLNALDREMADSYELTVRARDGGSPTLSSTVAVLVRLRDVNDNPPRVLEPVRRIKLAEDLPENTMVTCLEAYDPDLGENGTVEYRFFGEIGAKFAIDAMSGCVHIKDRLDHEEAQLHNLTVEMIDNGHPRLSSFCTILIEVVDVNENRFAPKFSTFAYEASVFENEPEGTEVTNIIATDQDDPKGPVTYSILGGDGLGHFSIDSDGRIRTARRLDRETAAFYWLIVAARDSSATPMSSRVPVYVGVLDRNDNRPFPSAPAFNGVVVENSPADRLVVRVVATDDDAPPLISTASQEDSDELRASSLTFKISQGNPQSFFKIDQQTGDIFTHKRQIDREIVGHFELEVTVSDDGVPPLSSKIPVFVSVEDENDNAPKFVDKFNEFKILANRKQTFLCRIFAVDEDISDGSKLLYSIVEGNEDGKLTLIPNTGEIYGKKLLARETIAMTMAVSDGKYKDLANVVFNILAPPDARNNSAPKLARANVTIHMAHEEALGRSVGLIEAVDPDGDMLWFYLTDGDGTFSLKPDTGELQLAGHVKLSAYFLTYVVTDGLHNISGKLRIVVQNVPEPDLKFRENFYNIDVPENASSGTVIFKLFNETVPSGTDLRYFIWNAFSLDAEQKFEVDPRKGHVFLVGQLNHEVTKLYVLHLEARGKRNRAFTMLSIKVNDVNDHKPKFLEADLQMKLSESTSSGRIVAELLAIDQDSGEAGKIGYKIVGGNDFKFFDMDEETGTLKLVKPLRHSPPEFVLFVKAQDYGNPPLSDFATVRFFVTSSTSGKFQLKQRSYVFRVPENLPVGSMVGKLSAHTSAMHRCSLQQNGKSMLKIHPFDGALFLASALDFEKSRRHEATVTCGTVDSSSSGSEDSVTVLLDVVDVNDRRPKFQREVYAGVVTENAAAGLVLTPDLGQPLKILASDADSRRFGTVVYEINGDETANELFEVDYSTGSIRTRKSLNFEAQRVHEFQVFAHDLGDPPLRCIVPATVRIAVRNVNDNPPVFDKSEFSAIVHLPTFDQSPVIKLTAYDADWPDEDFSRPSADQRLRFRLNNHRGLFFIDSQVGAINVKNSSLLTAGQRCMLNVSVTDGYYTTYTVVDVKTENFNNPPDFGFTRSLFEFEVVENSNFSTILFHLPTYGIENHRTLHYELSSEPHWNGHFRLDPKTGTFHGPERAIDRESTPTGSGYVQLIATLKDSYSNPPMSARCSLKITVLDINDNSPTFLQQPYVVRLLAGASLQNYSKPLCKIGAVDPDSGRNGTVGFKLIFGTTEKQARFAHFFTINETTGDLTLTADLSDEFLPGDQFELDVMAFDYGSPPLHSVAPIKIHFVSESTLFFDRPIFEAILSEISPVGTEVATLKPSSTQGLDSVGYFVIGDDLDSQFRLDFKSGRITTQKLLDYEKWPTYTLVIRAKNFHTNLSQDAILLVNVQDANDNAPFFGRSFYKFSVPENSHQNFLIGRIIAEDLDSDQNALVTYFIGQGEFNFPFKIDRFSGDLYSTTPSLDFESQSEYFFNVTAKDSGTPQLESAVVVLIVIVDVNDNAPKFTRLAYESQVHKDVAVGSFVTQVFAHDLDTVDRGQILTIDQKLNAESRDLYVLSILAKILSHDDHGTYPMQAKITVRRVNNNKPIFVAEKIILALQHDIPVNTTIFQAFAKDNSDKVEYSIRKKDSSDRTVENLKLDASSGKLEAVGDWSHLSGKTLKFVLVATDRGNPPLRDELPVQIEIEKRHASRVFSFSKSEFYFDVSEKAAIGHKIGVLPSSLGGTASKSVKFRILPSKPLDDPPLVEKSESPLRDFYTVFNVDPSGTVILTAKLDREMTSSYHFYVAARNLDEYGSADGFPAVSLALLHINLLDENDNSPRFSNSNRVTVSVKENSKIGTRVVWLWAEDADVGANAAVSYEIDPTELRGFFSVDPQTGWVTVAGVLDREKQDLIEMNITTRDQGQPELTGQNVTLVVNLLDENDQPPIFQRNFYEFSIKEEVALGTVVGQLIATDADLWPHNKTSFYIVGGNSEGLFGIHGNGILFIAGHLCGGKDDKRNLTVLATDGQFSTSVQVLIFVTVEPKKISSCNMEIFHIDVYENLTVGSKVLDSEKMFGKTKNFSRKSDCTLFGATSHFKLDSEGSVISYALLDREISDSMWLRLKFKPFDRNYCEIKIIFNILDVNDEVPMFSTSPNANSVELHENSAGPYPIFLTQFFACDHDLGNSSYVKFKFSGDVDASKFLVLEQSGAVFALKALDREEFAQYNLTIIAQDQGPVSLQSRKNLNLHILDVKDNPPLFAETLYVAKVLENLTVGAEILMVKAFSKDSTLNAEISYEISAENRPIVNDQFAVHRKTGSLTLKKSLDRESTDRYQFKIIAYDVDNPALRSESQIGLEVLDINDNAPVFRHPFYRFKVSEDESIGTTVGHVLADDVDALENAKVSYLLEDQAKFRPDGNSIFEMSHDGAITLLESLDFEKKKSYEFVMKAIDSGEPPLSAAVKLFIDIIDVNDNAPIFKNCNKTIIVKSSLTKGAEIHTLKLADPDGPTNGPPFVFEIFGKKHEDFELSNTGAIVLAKSAFSQSFYDLKIIAKDSGIPALSSNACHLYIRPVEQSRYPPDVQPFHTTIVAYYGEYQGGVVGRVRATDRDASDRLTFTVETLASSDANLFAVDVPNKFALLPSSSTKLDARRALTSLNSKLDGDDDNDGVPFTPALSKLSADAEGAEDIGDEDSSSKEETFAVHADDGRVTASAGLPLGEHRVNVSVTDGTFTSLTVSTIEVKSITNEMLSASISLEIPNCDSHSFVRLHMKNFVKSVASALGVRSQFVHILSLQDKVDALQDEYLPEYLGDVQILFAVKKSRTEWLKPEQTRERLASKWRDDSVISRRQNSATSPSSAGTSADDSKGVASSLEDSKWSVPSIGASPFEVPPVDAPQSVPPWLSHGARLIAETCRKESCGAHGDCRDALTLDDGRQTTALGGAWNFVSPRHKRAPECICYDGYSGISCEKNISRCSSKPCASNQICMPDDSPHGFFCSCFPGKSGQNCLSDVCSSKNTSCSDSTMSFNGRSFVRHTLWKSLAIGLELKLEFKTSSPFGTIFFCSGKTDFETLEILGSTLRYRLDLGSGENILTVKHLTVSDNRWHTVKIVRRHKRVVLHLDNKRHRAEMHTVGASNVLNLDGDHLYLGAQMPPRLDHEHDSTTPRQSLPAPFKNSPFVGCLRSVQLNGYHMAPVGPGVSLRGVRFSCELAGPPYEARGSFDPPPLPSVSRCIDGSSDPNCPRVPEAASGLPSPACSPGFAGKTCSNRIYPTIEPLTPCLSNPCLNKGVCISSEKKQFSCKCTQGWTGPTCSTAYPLAPSSNAGLLWYSTWPELAGIAALLLILVLLATCIVLACRKRNRFRYTKANYIQNVANDEITCDIMQPHSLSFKRYGGGGANGSKSATPIRPRLVNPNVDYQNKPPPPLPPRLRSFGGQHQNLLLSNLESAKSTGIPTVQVRPLSMIDRQAVDAASPQPPIGCMESAADYGSAAEELERLGVGRRSGRLFEGGGAANDVDDWKVALRSVDFTEDSLERLKAAALSLESPSHRRSRRKTTDSFAAQSVSSIQCLPEDDRISSVYHWDYSDWTNTLAPPPRPLPRDYDDPMERSEMSSLLHLDHGGLHSNGSLPGGVSRFEETDTEGDCLNDPDDDYMHSNAVRPNDPLAAVDDADDGSSLDVLEDAARGVDQFRRQLLALSRMNDNLHGLESGQQKPLAVAPPSRTLPARVSTATVHPLTDNLEKQGSVATPGADDAISVKTQNSSGSKITVHSTPGADRSKIPKKVEKSCKNIARVAPDSSHVKFGKISDAVINCLDESPTKLTPPTMPKEQTDV